MSINPKLQEKQCKLLYTTVARLSDAKDLAQAVVEAGLAFCVNIVPGILSVYTWKDTIHHEPECSVVFKTEPENAESLMVFIQQKHPYESPSILMGDVAAFGYTTKE